MKNPKHFLLIVLFAGQLFSQTVIAQVTITGSTGADGNYTSMTNAAGAFAAINATAQTGNNIVITITGNSTAEAGTNGLNEGVWTTLTIYPTVSGLTISGTVAGPLINLNGADKVTIDGRIGGSGSSIDLTISNLNTGNASTIQFINSAENNTLKYCTIKGAGTSATMGVIYFSTTSAGNGNDGNTIDNNNITSSASGRPGCAIYSYGTSTRENSGNTISNNNIYDFLQPGTASYGINLDLYTTTWTISGNSFYEQTSFVPTADVQYYAIRINNTDGVNFTISGNNIGGSSASCGGSALTKTNAKNNIFYAIYLNVGTSTASNVQDNVIRNFAWSNSGTAAWTGIHVQAGTVNIGTVTGNTIGATTGTGSITITDGPTESIVYGINIPSSNGNVDIQNNKIGSITTATSNPAYSCHIVGITKNNTGTTIIRNNTIGSTITAGSLKASSESTGNIQSIIGINAQGNGTFTIENNMIANLTNATTNANVAATGLTLGIYTGNGNLTISNNTIRDLSNANANNRSDMYASVCGINLGSSSSNKITGNTIYNLSNTLSSFTGSITGIYYSSNIATTNVVSGNFIHSLSVSDASTAASVYGIKMNTGNATYYNNIISLGGNTATTIYGIYDNGTYGNTNNIYFNSVYIGGSLGSGTTNKSYALYSATRIQTRNFRSNIFENARSTANGASLHYAAYFNYAGTTLLTLDYNDYYAPGIGGVLGFYSSADVNTLPLISGFDAKSLAINPLFATPGGTVAIDYKPSSDDLIGTVIGTITTDYAGTTRKVPPTIGAYEVPLDLYVDVYISGVFQAQYYTMKNAFDKINDGTHTGTIELRIKGNPTETVTASLYQSGYTGTGGTSNYTSVTIYPTVTGIRVSGNLAAPLIDLNGADNVTIDGRVNATGSAKDLAITNSNTGAAASTIQFKGSAENNTVKYCNIKGSETSTTMGVIFFSTAVSGNGNDDNMIENNNITSDPAGRPVNAIYSSGTASYDNSGNTINNNNIYDFLKHGTNSNGINLASNTTDWTISGNSFYETTSFVPAAAVQYRVILIDNISGANFTVSDNYIGGSSAFCGGTPWIKTNAGSNNFVGIYLSVGSVQASSIQNNTIRNIVWSNSGNANWLGIGIAAGAVNIGTVTGNTIGATVGTGSITITSGSNGMSVYGIISTGGSATIDCQNNNIGSITTACSNPIGSSNLIGISKTTSGATTIRNNLIGSSSSVSSLNASSGSTGNAQKVIGIEISGTSVITIDNNTIANLTNGTTNENIATRGLINGIASSGVISDNTIHDLTIANANNSSTNTASVCGIVFSGGTLTGNTIYNLSNTYASYAGSIIGLFVNAIGTFTNGVSSNFVHSLSTTSSTTSSLYGIKIYGGETTYSNNIISLGGNTVATIYGIYESGVEPPDNSKLYFNTVYIDGSLSSGVSNKSYALYSNSSISTRNLRNNIFMNARSTTSSASLHYGAYFNYAVSTSLTLDYNDYYTPGTGGVLGYYNGADVNSLPLITGFDANSLAINPVFENPGGNIATDYKPSSNELIGTTINTITTDYSGAIRAATPTMGALESINMLIWTGSTSTNWNTSTNWSSTSIPTLNTKVTIPDVTNDPVINDSNMKCNELLIQNGAKLTINPGKSLVASGNTTINGTDALIIKSDETGNGAFIDNGTITYPNSGSAKVELYLTACDVSLPTQGCWHYVTSPISNGLSGVFDGDYMRFWNEITGAWSGYVTTSAMPLNGMEGFVVSRPTANPAVKVFTGTLNTACPAKNLTRTEGTGYGYNLTGNPYPSQVDLNSPGISWNNVEAKVWYYSKFNKTYKPYVVYGIPGTNPGSRYAPSMQGFFVHVPAAGTASLTIGNGARTTTFDTTYYKDMQSSKDLLWLTAQGPTGMTDETVVYFRPDATTGYDVDFDCQKLYGTENALQLYSVTSDASKVAINALSFAGLNTVIPVEFSIFTHGASGNYSLTASRLETFRYGTTLLLEDRKTGTTQVLNTDPVYHFIYSDGDDPGRFLLHMYNPSFGINDPAEEKDLQIYSYVNDIYIKDISGTAENGEFYLYNMMGQEIAHNPVSSLSLNIYTFNLPDGYYIVRIITKDKTYNGKVYLY